MLEVVVVVMMVVVVVVMMMVVVVLQGGTQRWMTLLTDRREHSVTTLKEKITRDIR